MRKTLATIECTSEGWVVEIWPDDLDYGERHVAKTTFAALHWLTEEINTVAAENHGAVRSPCLKDVEDEESP